MPRSLSNIGVIRKKFSAIGHVPAEELPGVTLEFCERVARIARTNVPVDTGELRDSIEVERPGEHNRFSGSANITAAVVVNSPHAAAQEYGTRHIVANPFFRRAIAEAGGKARMKAFVRGGLSKGLKKAARS